MVPVRSVSAFLLLLGLLPRPLAAQAERADVGSFSILREGVRVGREQFSIRYVGSAEGVAFELRAESAIDEQRLATRLEVDSAGTPLRYSADVRRGTATVLRLGGQRTRGRFATLARTERGEAAREYLLPAGAVVLEADAFHQAALLLLEARARTDFTLRALAPMENRERAVRVTRDAVLDTVTVAGVRRPASRWIVDDAGDRRVLWVDADGRVLRITVPARGLEAIRDDVPR
ncbi:MAG: hypothetical protein MUD17_08345 [Gemmatimonadaceae bacterium]|jgi:hypothetical protein|nr:hypothetical protein [Gemmatimonadaceae bacterium]